MTNGFQFKNGNENNIACAHQCIRVTGWLQWRRGVEVITTAQLHSAKPELRFCAVSSPACGVSDVCNGENL